MSKDLNELRERLRNIEFEIRDLETDLKNRRKTRDEIVATLNKIEFLISGKIEKKTQRSLNPSTPKLDEKILLILSRDPKTGMTTDHLHTEIQNEWNEPAVLSSVRTYLTNLRKAGKVDRHNERWLVAPNGKLD